MILGFQSSAFQNNGFQNGQTSTQPVGGGYGDEKKKKRYIVRKGNRILVFANEEDALFALEPQEVAVKQYPSKKAKAKKVQAQPPVLETPKPVEQVDLQEIVAFSIRYAAEQEYQFLLKAQEYEALFNFYKKFKQREEEEILCLLLAA